VGTTSAMVAFSQPVRDDNPPTKRKRTINPRLLNDNNVSSDAIKRRKLEALKSNLAMGQASSGSSSTQQASVAATSSTNTVEDLSFPTPSVPPSTRQASVEIVDDDEDHLRRNAGAPKNPDTILESVDDDDDMDFTPLVSRKDQAAKKKQTEVVEESTEKEPSKKETDNEELGKLN